MNIHSLPKRLLAAFAATAALLSSCYKDIDLKLKPFEPQMVLNSFIEADSLISVHVSRTWTTGENLPTHRLDDAEVTVYVNGLLQPPQQSIARAGDSVRIAVRKAGYAEASAGVVVPGQARLLSVDTIRFNDPYLSDAMRCLIRFKDLEAGRKNYYRLIVEHEIAGDDGIREFFNDTFQCNQDAALSDGFKDVTDEILGTWVDNVYGVFTDDLFDGEEYTLNISFSPQFSTEYEYVLNYESGEYVKNPRVAHVRYTFTLATLSPSAYLYLKSRMFHNGGGGNDYFTEPSPIYSNVSNGLGIVGAFQTSSLTIDMPFQSGGRYRYN